MVESFAPRALLQDATRRLRAAGVASPEHDAAELLAHVLGTRRSQLFLVDRVSTAAAQEYDDRVGRRAAREPLQHLIGRAWFRHVSVEVGPGVFVPRPETELLAGWAIEQARAVVSRLAGARTSTTGGLAGARTSTTGGLAGARTSTTGCVVVDLCTGSGVIAKAIADEVPGARVYAVELDPAAHAWAERNLAGTGVDLRLGDLATAFDDLVGEVDVLVSNPPYVPLEAWESVAPEARDHDPHLALFSGDDGLDAIRVIAQRGVVLLKPGGVVGVEHADAQGRAAPEVFSSSGRWEEVRDHRDLADRPRYLTARRPR